MIRLVVRKKVCRRCGISKDPLAFPPTGQICKKCRQAKAMETRRSKSYCDFPVITEKMCSECKEVKLSKDFQRTKGNRSGLASQCKACRRRYFSTQHKSREFNRTKTKWHAIRLNAKRRGFVCTFSYEEYVAWWDAQPDRCFYCGCTIEEFLAIKNSIINKTLPTWKRFWWLFANPRFQHIVDFTIDRKDSTGDYAITNMAKACWICNSIKSSVFTAEQMKIVANLLRTDFIIEHVRTGE